MPDFSYKTETDARIAWGRVLDVGEKTTKKVQIEENKEQKTYEQVTVTFRGNTISYLKPCA